MVWLFEVEEYCDVLLAMLGPLYRLQGGENAIQDDAILNKPYSNVVHDVRQQGSYTYIDHLCQGLVGRGKEGDELPLANLLTIPRPPPLGRNKLALKRGGLASCLN